MVHTLKSNSHKSFEVGITASTTQTQGNGAMTGSLNEIGTVANDNDTVTLPSVSEGLEVSVINNGVNILKVFPASGDNLGNGLNSSITLKSNTEKDFFGVDDTNWVNFGSSDSAGASVTLAYGSMYENNSSGSATDSTAHTWITAGVGKLDSDGVITFSDNSGGDRLVVGTDGAGDYEVQFAASFTNAGGKDVTGTVYKNGVATTIIDVIEGDSNKQRNILSYGILTLAAADYITLHLVSETASDLVDIYHCHLIIEQLS